MHRHAGLIAVLFLAAALLGAALLAFGLNHNARAGDLPTREAPLPRPPLAYGQLADARDVAETFGSSIEVRDYLMGRFGPLPWTFKPDARTPFMEPFVVERLEPMVSRGQYAEFPGVWAYTRQIYGLPNFDRILFGPVVRAVRNGFDPSTERAMADKYMTGVYRSLGGCPAYRYGDPRPPC